MVASGYKHGSRALPLRRMNIVPTPVQLYCMKRHHGFPSFFTDRNPSINQKEKEKTKTPFSWPLMSLSPSMHLAAPNQNLPGHCNLDTIDQHCSDLNFKQPAILIPLSPSSESKHYGFYREEGPGHTLDLHKLRISEKAVNTNRINFN